MELEQFETIIQFKEYLKKSVGSSINLKVICNGDSIIINKGRVFYYREKNNYSPIFYTDKFFISHKCIDDDFLLCSEKTQVSFTNYYDADFCTCNSNTVKNLSFSEFSDESLNKSLSDKSPSDSIPQLPEPFASIKKENFLKTINNIESQLDFFVKVFQANCKHEKTTIGPYCEYKCDYPITRVICELCRAAVDRTLKSYETLTLDKLEFCVNNAFFNKELYDYLMKYNCERFVYFNDKLFNQVKEIDHEPNFKRLREAVEEYNKDFNNELLSTSHKGVYYRYLEDFRK